MVSDNNIEYRFATKEEQSKIYDFAMRAIAEAILPQFAEDAGEDLYDRILNGDPNDVAIAEDKSLDAGIVGFIEIDPKRTTKAKEVHIRGIFVLESHRRIGIGKKLLSMMLNEKLKTGEKLLVNAYTEEGVKFWRSFGFKIQRYALSYQPDT